MTQVLLVALVALASLGAVSAPVAQSARSQSDSKLVRVWLTTVEGGHADEVAGRQASLKHLTAALARQKKLVALVDKEELADVTLDVRERRTEVPRVVFGVGAKPGDPPGGLAPARTVKLLVLLKWQDDRVNLTNKNKPLESAMGWSSAADDIAKQIEKWISDRRQRILDSRIGPALRSIHPWTPAPRRARVER